MNFSELFRHIHVTCTLKQRVQGIEDDSRKVSKDWLFICQSDEKRSGYPYVQEAIAKGAIVLWEKEDREFCYHVDSINDALPILLNAFYRNPCDHLCTIGVTGTNGKTSVTLILRQMFQACGNEVMVIGTHHIRYLDNDVWINNTTPSACTLAYYFHQARLLQIPYLLMEVSSHAIDQDRICFISYNFILYTNIMEDHLDYHFTNIHYTYTKFKLRSYLKDNGVIIVNHDVAKLYPLYQLSDDKIITFGKNQAHFRIHDEQYFANETSFSLEDETYHMNLLGRMNVYNVSEALIVMYLLHFSKTACKEVVKGLTCISGRLEVLNMQGIYVWIDYAHTESALEALLKFACDVKEAKVICVVGCGGNREVEKRAKMANVAFTYSDYVILTADNPRDEEIHHILFDMLCGQKGNYEIRENRACAIKTSMKIAQTHDIIVIAGKGDETTQEIQGKNYPLQDKELVEKYRKLEE